MPADWKQHCPIDEDGLPVERQAWREGWQYRIRHGPGQPDRATVLGMVGRTALLSVWMQGFSAADSHERSG